MPSEHRLADEAYVWIWLSEASEPVVAGRIVKVGNRHLFTYGQSYRDRATAIPLSPFELPLETGTFEPDGLHQIHTCLRDAAPDAWGRRVLEYRYPASALGELDYLLLSGSDRIGALDFQVSASAYAARDSSAISLEELIQAAEYVESGQSLPPELDAALMHGTSVGGARPKALIMDGDVHCIAKFGSITDTFAVVKAEYIAMRIALLAGLTVAPVKFTQSLGKDVLLVGRYDRYNRDGDLYRRGMLSGLSLLRLHEMEARYASYRDLADVIRQRFLNPTQQMEELFKRLVFNVLIGNTDDHARNHAAFWDGRNLSLTPAYDICPQVRSGQEASQAMDIGGIEGRLSTLRNVLSVCGTFQLNESYARKLIEEMTAVIEQQWEAVCDEVDLAPMERDRLWRRSILNPFCFQGW